MRLSYTLPTGADLHAFLAGAGVLPATLSAAQQMIDLQSPVATAYEEWEELTGYQPFIAQRAVSVRRFTPREGEKLIFFGTGIITPTGLIVKTGVDTTYAGDTQTINEDFFLRPDNAEEEGKPYRWLEFYWRPSMYQRNISITARWGYSQRMPEDAWRAILCGAAARTIPFLAASVAQGALEWREGDVSRKYGEGGAYGSVASQWREEFEGCAHCYAIPKVY